ncbi:MAG: hypothetical protein IT380_06565 [Myxococcales bacterium]|nr:hypothetical protein [Myxococcales bacterium]
MAWDVVMFGAVCIPERNVEEWLASDVAREAFPWLDELGGDDVHHDTPEALLTFLKDVTVAPHELFDVTLVDGKVTVHCYVSEDPYRETSQALALLFASAADFGAVGELVIYGYQGIRFGERLTVKAGRTAWSKLGHDELAAVEQLRNFTELNARIHERYDSLVGRPPAPMDPRKSRLVVHPFTGRRVRVAEDGIASSAPVGDRFD